METLKNKPIFILAVLIATCLTTGTACEHPSGITVTEPDDRNKLTMNMSSGEPVFFNPQPEPPARFFLIEITESRDGSWEGNYVHDDVNGRISIETQSSLMRGKTVHLVQTWTLHPPDPIHPPDPVHPPDPIQPVQIMMKGHHNVANSKMIMNGKTGDDGWMMQNGTNVHLRAMISESTDGLMMAGGELMFNPQPEPPEKTGSR